MRRSPRRGGGCQPLDGNDAIEAGVARLPHFAHAAGANGCEDFVGAEFFAGGQRHEESVQFSGSGGGGADSHGQVE